VGDRVSGLFSGWGHIGAGVPFGAIGLLLRGLPAGVNALLDSFGVFREGFLTPLRAFTKPWRGGATFGHGSSLHQKLGVRPPPTKFFGANLLGRVSFGAYYFRAQNIYWGSEQNISARGKPSSRGPTNNPISCARPEGKRAPLI